MDRLVYRRSVGSGIVFEKTLFKSFPSLGIVAVFHRYAIGLNLAHDTTIIWG